MNEGVELIGMDTRIPQHDRAFVMVLALLNGSRFTAEESAQIVARLNHQQPDRRRKLRCLRGHVRSPDNLTSKGACRICVRESAAGEPCSGCGHPRSDHEGGRECYHVVGGKDHFCGCTGFTERS